jgi:uncharacterized low-complexity protein
LINLKLPTHGESPMNKQNMKPLAKATATAVSAAFLATAAISSPAFAAENPFQADELRSGYNLAGDHAEGKCGEGKCGEGKCGEGKAESEGKCGEGKCGEGKAESEGKCGESKADSEGKCGEGKCGGAA